MFKIGESIHVDSKNLKVIRFLGQGGMGQVFEVENIDTKERHAMKYLSHFIDGDDYHRSLINEWNVAQKVQHQNVINYLGFHDGIEEPKHPMIFMELANDGSLDDYLSNLDEKPDESTFLSLFHQLIDGMEAINEHLVHRDIKPDNIFIEEGSLKIADFGLAKIASERTRSKSFKGWGTEPYIAPEAYRMESNTIQMDMYSIGHVMYQLGALIHAFGNPLKWEDAHMMAVAKPLNEINTCISPAVAAVITKLISKRPKDRYKSWEDVRSALNSATAPIEAIHEAAVNRLLKTKLGRDTIAEKERSTEQQARDEEERKNALIKFQLDQEVIAPLTNFVNDYNSKAASSSSLLTIRSSKSFSISFEHHTAKIWFEPISRQDVLIRKVRYFGFDRAVEVEVFPELNGKKVLAWGGMEMFNRTGLNIVLVENEEDEYGDFFILENTNSGFSREPRTPEPFAFSRHEFKEEIQHIRATHIYNTNVINFDAQYIIDSLVSSF